MEKGIKVKLIVMLVIAILLGLFVVGVTGQAVSQYRQRCHDLNSSLDGEDSAPYSSQGCCGRQYRSCWSVWPFS